MTLHYRGHLIIWDNLSNEWVLNNKLAFKTLNDTTKYVDYKLKARGIK